MATSGPVYRWEGQGPQGPRDPSDVTRQATGLLPVMLCPFWLLPQGDHRWLGGGASPLRPYSAGG